MINIRQEELMESGEVISEKIRKHWIVYLEDLLLHAFGCLIFTVAAYYLAYKGTLHEMFAVGSEYGAMTLIVFVLIFWTSFFYAWTKNYFDVWFVTNRHIIAIEQKQIFERVEASMELTRIQDVTSEKNGFLASLLGYGKLKIQSAGTDQEFMMDYVADIDNVTRRIMELRDSVHVKSAQPIVNNL